MTTFILGALAAGETSTIRFWIAGILSAALFVGRMTKACFDSLFETIGFAIGRPLFRLPLAGRMLAGACSLAVMAYLLYGRPWWFVAACLALTAIDLFAAIGSSLNREPRLLLMPSKAFAITAITLWGWETNWLWAIATYLVTRRAFQFLLEGMTLCAAERQQSDRDRRTAALFESLRDGSAPSHGREPLIVYLRPFAITGRIKADDGEFQNTVDGTARRDVHDAETKQWSRTELPLASVRLRISEGASLLEQNSEMEQVLEQALRGAGHFIALGHSGEALGAGRLPAEEANWKASVALLIDAAALCLVVPSANPGTQWEIRYIVENGHLDKCCLVMPPAVGETASYAKEWAAARAALADVLPLPEYQTSGFLFRCGPGASAVKEPPADTPAPPSPSAVIAMIVQTLFPELPRWQVETGSGWISFGVHGGVKFYTAR